MSINISTLALSKKFTADSLEGAGALIGDPGKSAYEIDVSNGFTGTEAEWLESIKGAPGKDGADGIYVTSMNVSEDNRVTALLSNGNTLHVGTFNTIKGDKGDAGAVPRIDDNTGRWFIGDYDTGYVAVPNTEISFNDLADAPTIPVAMSQLTNDENFIKRTVNNLINYHAKNTIYTKEEVNNLINNINRLTTSIVNELPTSDISDTTIYLIAAADSVYNQYMYIQGEWANLGNTSINLEEYVTIVQLQAELIEKSDINHTHEELHNHGNFPLLETITAELIQKWNSKFSGNYNDLTNKPNIPIVTNDLTNELKADYDDAVAKKHAHPNVSVLDRFSEDEKGNPLYNNNPIGNGGGGSGAGIDDTITGLNSTWSSNKISNKLSVVDNISIAQKTVNQRGYVDLIDEEILISVLNAKTLGTVVTTQVKLLIELTDSIEKYDLLNFEFGIKSPDRIYKGNSSIINTSNIVYNNSDETINNNDGSVFWLMFEVDSPTAGSFGAMHHMLKCWFKDDRHLVVYQAFNPQSLTIFNTYVINSIKGVKLNPIVIDPVEHVNTEQGLEDLPVGHIMTQIGSPTFKHYLECDGSVYNITDYPHLAQYIKSQFGTFNHYGGDGISTFAVPLYAKEYDFFSPKMTGNSTPAPYVATCSSSFGGSASAGPWCAFDTNINTCWCDKTSGAFPDWLKIDLGESKYLGALKITSFKESNNPLSLDIQGSNDDVEYTLIHSYRTTNWGNSETRIIDFDEPVSYRFIRFQMNSATGNRYSQIAEVQFGHVSRRTFIKYEPTYFMNIQGFRTETTLWSGAKIIDLPEGTRTIDEDIILADEIKNYEKIEIHYKLYRKSDGHELNPQYRSIRKSDIFVGDNSGKDALVLSYVSTYVLSFNIRFAAQKLIKVVYTLNKDGKLGTSMDSFKLYRIVGINYKSENN